MFERDSKKSSFSSADLEPNDRTVTGSALDLVGAAPRCVRSAVSLLHAAALCSEPAVIRSKGRLEVAAAVEAELRANALGVAQTLRDKALDSVAGSCDYTLAEALKHGRYFQGRACLLGFGLERVAAVAVELVHNPSHSGGTSGAAQSLSAEQWIVNHVTGTAIFLWVVS